MNPKGPQNHRTQKNVERPVRFSNTFEGTKTRRRRAQVPHYTFRVLNGSSLTPKKCIWNPKGPKTAKLKNWRVSCAVLIQKSSGSADFLSQPRRWRTQGAPTAPLGSYMGQVRTRKGEFGTRQGPKTAEQKIGELPVLFLSTFRGLTVQCGRSRIAELSRDAT